MCWCAVKKLLNHYDIGDIEALAGFRPLYWLAGPFVKEFIASKIPELEVGFPERSSSVDFSLSIALHFISFRTLAKLDLEAPAIVLSTWKYIFKCTGHFMCAGKKLLISNLNACFLSLCLQKAQSLWWCHECWCWKKVKQSGQGTSSSAWTGSGGECQGTSSHSPVLSYLTLMALVTQGHVMN